MNLIKRHLSINSLRRARFWHLFCSRPAMKTLAVLSVIAFLPAISQSIALPTVGGSVSWEGVLSPGKDLSDGGTVSDSKINAYFESSKNLVADLPVDQVGPVFANPGSIGAGISINTYLLHGQRTSDSSFSLQGAITFETEILGMILHSTSLHATDSLLGVSGVFYDTSSSVAGFRGVGNASFGSTSSIITI